MAGTVCPSSRSVLSTALGALLAAGALAPTAPAQLGALGEIAAFAGEIKTQLVLLKGNLKTEEQDFAADVKVIRDAVKAGTTTPAESQLQLFDRLVALFTTEDGLLNGTLDQVEQDATLHLENLALLPNAMTVGDGGLIDAALHGATGLVHLATARSFIKVRAFSKLLEKLEDYDLVVDRRAQIADPMTPTEDSGTPAPAPKTMLRIDLLLAGSERGGVLGDGIICLAGTADPSNGADVTVSLLLPGHAPVDVVAAIDAATHRWQVTVPPSLPGNLPEGNYSVDVTQGGVTISDSIGMQ